MNGTVLESTTLAAVAYDESENTLQLVFRSGAIYQYFGVACNVHEELLYAVSKGRYFNEAIRGRFAHRLITSPEADASNTPALRPEGAR